MVHNLMLPCLFRTKATQQNHLSDLDLQLFTYRSTSAVWC